MIFPSPFNSTFIVAFCIAYLYGGRPASVGGGRVKFLFIGTFATDEAAKQTNVRSLLTTIFKRARTPCVIFMNFERSLLGIKFSKEQSLRKMAKSGNKLEVKSLLDSRVNVDAVDWVKYYVWCVKLC